MPERRLARTRAAYEGEAVSVLAMVLGVVAVVCSLIGLGLSLVVLFG